MEYTVYLMGMVLTFILDTQASIWQILWWETWYYCVSINTESLFKEFKQNNYVEALKTAFFEENEAMKKKHEKGIIGGTTATVALFANVRFQISKAWN